MRWRRGSDLGEAGGWRTRAGLETAEWQLVDVRGGRRLCSGGKLAIGSSGSHPKQLQHVDGEGLADACAAGLEDGRVVAAAASLKAASIGWSTELPSRDDGGRS